MRIVADTNILFSFFKESSLTRYLILSPELKLISPEIALTELKKYSNEIIKKSKNINFSKELSNLEKIVSFIPKKQYTEFLKAAEKISPDIDDAEFFGLCLKEKCPLWSNDSALKIQEKINVLSTKDILDILI
jgi:predicted nucleic acid-binding protein